MIDFRPLTMRWLWRGTTLLWMAGTLAAALLPPTWTFGVGGPFWHVIAFAGLTLFLHTWQPVDRTIAVAWTYGALVEGMQSLVPYRTPSLGDLAINALGIVAGLTARQIALVLSSRFSG